jgi:ubiquinone/menaquinone biosynthesis C-methylase UbiE
VLQFEIGDVRRLIFPDRHFDVLACFEVIEHVAEQDVVLDELSRVHTHVRLYSQGNCIASLILSERNSVSFSTEPIRGPTFRNETTPERSFIQWRSRATLPCEISTPLALSRLQTSSVRRKCSLRSTAR